MEEPHVPFLRIAEELHHGNPPERAKVLRLVDDDRVPSLLGERLERVHQQVGRARLPEFLRAVCIGGNVARQSRLLAEAHAELVEVQRLVAVGLRRDAQRERAVEAEEERPLPGRRKASRLLARQDRLPGPRAADHDHPPMARHELERRGLLFG